MLEGTGSVGLPDDSQIRNVCQALARLYSARVPSSSDQGVSVNAHSQILLALRLLASYELVRLLSAHKTQLLTMANSKYCMHVQRQMIMNSFALSKKSHTMLTCLNKQITYIAYTSRMLKPLDKSCCSPALQLLSSTLTEISLVQTLLWPVYMLSAY